MTLNNRIVGIYIEISDAFVMITTSINIVDNQWLVFKNKAVIELSHSYSQFLFKVFS